MTQSQMLYNLRWFLPAKFWRLTGWTNIAPRNFIWRHRCIAFRICKACYRRKNVFVLLQGIAIWEERKMTGNATNFAIQIFVGKNCSLKNNKTKQHFKKWPEIRQMLSVDIWLSKWEDPLLWAPVVACLISTEQLRNSQSNWKTIVTCSILTEQLRYLGAAEKCMVPKKHRP